MSLVSIEYRRYLLDQSKDHVLSVLQSVIEWPLLPYACLSTEASYASVLLWSVGLVSSRYTTSDDAVESHDALRQYSVHVRSPTDMCDE